MMRLGTVPMMMLPTSGVVHAAVIDFNTLSFDRFTTYTENNFTVVATSGACFKLILDGKSGASHQCRAGREYRTTYDHGHRQLFV